MILDFNTLLCLSNRAYRVKYKDKLSSFFVPNGVSLSSVLSPLLFALLINDVYSVLSSDCFFCYADDLKIFYPISGRDDCDFLQIILSNLSSWCTRNSLSLCPDKCNILSFIGSRTPMLHRYIIDGVMVTRVIIIKYLDVSVVRRKFASGCQPFSRLLLGSTALLSKIQSTRRSRP